MQKSVFSRFGPSSGKRTDLAARLHPGCVVCGAKNPGGFHLNFILQDDGSVQCRFDCRRSLEGYTRFLHGGIIAMLLDAAMTHCLFQHGISAVTGELKIRYRSPVDTDTPAVVRGRIERSTSRLHYLQAEIVQGNRVKVEASAKFMHRPDLVEEANAVRHGTRQKEAGS